MFGQSNETAYDLRFSLWNIPIRVHPIFWATAAFLSWVPQRLDLTFIGMLCVFFAILAHELGHALVNKIYGWRSEIVLEFFGGYATTTRHSYGKNIVVCAAGPLVGLSIWGLCKIAVIIIIDRKAYPGEIAAYALSFSLFINFIWSLMNLMPVFPLDGGQISRNLLMWLSPRNGALYSVNLSILCAGGIALWAMRCKYLNEGFFGLDPTFLAIMFAVLCYQSIQVRNMMQQGGSYR
ncbi:MAG: M50 family metallopeptidase [Planctomycetota bacterium]|nr:M50 family metallopeptidase [Planctomycetota bacterium]MDA1213679.1 M50 family metallopeptidase [Planctomycetota bacterium]